MDEKPGLVGDRAQAIERVGRHDDPRGVGATCELREDAIVPVICPTCQCVSGTDVSIVRLLCMGLFSIFLVGRAQPHRSGGDPSQTARSVAHVMADGG
jgi:hypothetical protein